MSCKHNTDTPDKADLSEQLPIYTHYENWKQCHK